MLAALLLSLMLGAVPPLGEGQRVQLETADDTGEHWDEPAIYPLLTNAAAWQVETRVDRIPGLTIPDFPALAADPATHRGGLFLIEGLFIKESQVPVLRPGPWGQTLTQWVVQTDPVKDEVVIVYLTHPPSATGGATPRLGEPVALAGRFYKLWPSRTLQGVPITYLLFVGHGAAVGAGAAGVTPGSSTAARGPSPVAIAVVAAAVIGAFFFLLRRLAAFRFDPKPTASQLRRAESRELREQRPPADDADPDEGPPLPEDPAAALVELERRRAAD